MSNVLQRTLDRLGSHILVHLFLDTSRMMQQPNRTTDNHAMNTFALVTRWVVVFGGMFGGGRVTGWIHWILSTLSGYWSPLPYLVVLLTIILGPDLLPPITPLNGCEDSQHRWMSATIFACFYWCSSYYNKTTIATTTLWTVSAIWHLYGGHVGFIQETRNISVHLQRLEESGGQQERMEQTLADASKILMVFYFQVGAGVGMLLATYQIYSWGVFLYLLGSLLATNIIFFVLTRDRPTRSYNRHDRTE